MVAPALLRGLAWPAAAVAATMALALLALHGERPRSGIGRFEMAGLLAQVNPEELRELSVVSGGRRLRLVREGDAWRPEPAGTPFDKQALAGGLRFLRATAPERVLVPDELPRNAAKLFGLDPPKAEVVLRTIRGEQFIVLFGDFNPLGLSRYTRISGRDEVYLLPGYVAGAWEKLAEPP